MSLEEQCCWIFLLGLLLWVTRDHEVNSTMMLQHPGLGPSEISASAVVPCLSPPGSLLFDDFTNLTPLVKEELRFAIQNKRLSSGMSSTVSDSVGTTSETSPAEPPNVKKEITPEECERRKRRRERNKIAAAKCRNKKKERTDCLQKESEKLESINAELKAQIEELKNEKQQLVYMLNLHRPTCIVRAQNGRTPEDERNLFIQQIKEGTLQG
uniref:Activating transcription factor 3 n=1 Tax=Lepisosteus oculatus TaxID=7918 RepID=W5LXP6_LEPOC